MAVEVVSKAHFSADVIVVNVTLQSAHGHALQIRLFCDVVFGDAARFDLHARQIARCLFVEVLGKTVAAVVIRHYAVLNNHGVRKSCSVAVENAV